ncbi:MAG: porin family protein [Ginsengibacter sp.]
MKKTLIVVASLFLMISATKAQGVHFGLKAGMNASSLSNTNSDSKIGFNAGALAHIHTSSKSWAIQPELVYSVEGAKSKSPLLGGTDKVNTNLNYLNVPVLVQYLFSNGFRLEAGPQIGFLMSAKSKVGSASTDIKNFYNTTNISIPVGLGYLTSYGLGFDARYNFGLSEVGKNSTSKVHSNVFQFGLFYQFSDSKMK